MQESPSFFFLPAFTTKRGEKIQSKKLAKWMERRTQRKGSCSRNPLLFNWYFFFLPPTGDWVRKKKYIIKMAFACLRRKFVSCFSTPLFLRSRVSSILPSSSSQRPDKRKHKVCLNKAGFVGPVPCLFPPFSFFNHTQPKEEEEEKNGGKW